MRCPNCRHSLAAGAKYCHTCGIELPPAIAEQNVAWYYDPVFVLLSIFLVLAAFGLPLLWKSPRFSFLQKAVISLVTIIYTGALFEIGRAHV